MKLSAIPKPREGVPWNGAAYPLDFWPARPGVPWPAVPPPGGIPRHTRDKIPIHSKAFPSRQEMTSWDYRAGPNVVSATRIPSFLPGGPNVGSRRLTPDFRRRCTWKIHGGASAAAVVAGRVWLKARDGKGAKVHVPAYWAACLGCIRGAGCVAQKELTHGS